MNMQHTKDFYKSENMEPIELKTKITAAFPDQPEAVLDQIYDLCVKAQAGNWTDGDAIKELETTDMAYDLRSGVLDFLLTQTDFIK